MFAPKRFRLPRTDRLVPVLLVLLAAVAAPQSAAQEEQKLGIRTFAASGKRAKAVAGNVEQAFLAAWALERPQDSALGGRAPKIQRRESSRIKAAVAAGKKANLSHIIDGVITKKRKAKVSLLLIDVAAGKSLGKQTVTLRKKFKAKDFTAAAKKLAALIPEPPPPPEVVEEEPPPVETAPVAEATAAVAPTPEPAPPAPESEAEGGGGGFGSVLAGTGLFFLGSGITALAAGGAFAGVAIVGRDWESKAALNSGLREEVNDGIFVTSLVADIVVVTAVVVTLAGAGVLTAGLLIE